MVTGGGEYAHFPCTPIFESTIELLLLNYVGLRVTRGGGGGGGGG